MKEVREACKKVRRDVFDLSNRLLYTKWPTTAINITGNHAHYMIGKTIRALDDLISALKGLGEEE